jgi:hypothetical protein
MAFPHANDLIEIENRNRLRHEASLPLLSVETEMRRLQAAREEAELEAEWEKRRPEFARWIGEADGWLSKMGRYSVARQQVRKVMRARQTDAGDR